MDRTLQVGAVVPILWTNGPGRGSANGRQWRSSRSEEWSDSDDEDRQRDFVALLNRAISEFVRAATVSRSRFGCFLFRKPQRPGQPEISPISSLQNSTTRRVVGRYGQEEEGSDAGGLLAPFWLHAPLRQDGWEVVRRASRRPTTSPTTARMPDSFRRRAAKKIKEIENNAAVMGQFVMWRDFLVTHRRRGPAHAAISLLSFSTTAHMELDIGVPGRALEVAGVGSDLRRCSNTRWPARR